MKIATRVGLLLVIFGATAIAARAQTSIDPRTFTDPRVILNDPSCPSGAFCIDLSYTGNPKEFTLLPFGPLQFLVPGSGYPNPFEYSCSEDIPLFRGSPAFTFPGLPVDRRGKFHGCDFFGYIAPGTFTIAVLGGPVVLELPPGFSCTDANCSDGEIPLTKNYVTPEPDTLFLYLTGLILVLAFTRKRWPRSGRASASLKSI
jgi:hypothetical protein